VLELHQHQQPHQYDASDERASVQDGRLYAAWRLSTARYRDWICRHSVKRLLASHQMTQIDD